MAQRLRIHLPPQETWVRSLIWEDPACRGAAKPVCQTAGPTRHGHRACALQSPNSTPREATEREAREPQLQSASHFPHLEKSLCCNRDLAQSDSNIKTMINENLKIKKNNARQNLQSQENAIKHHRYIFHRRIVLLRFRGKVQGWLNWKPLVTHWDFHFWS